MQVEVFLHVQVDSFGHFVLISMLRGQPKTPPSGDDLAVLNYHLNMFFREYLPGVIDDDHLPVLSNQRSLWPQTAIPVKVLG